MGRELYSPVLFYLTGEGPQMGNNLYNRAMELPLRPGVYIMLDGGGDVIYIGKAKALKNRVSSYFSGSHDMKTTAMVSRVRDFNVIIANSEFDALVLENALIKKHRPKYNIMLKDDKGYPFIRLDIRSQYPKFSIAGRRQEDGAKYFGPYGGRVLSKEIIDTVCKALKLPTCNRKFPREIGKERPCLNYHIGACNAYCLKDTPRSLHSEAIDQAVMVFEGKSEELIGRLEREMEEMAGALRFEQAAERRDRIGALGKLQKRGTVLSSVLADADVIGYYRGAGKSCFVVLHYIGGQLLGKEYELLENPLESVPEAVSAIIRQHYARGGAYPKIIYLPADLEDIRQIEQSFSEQAGRRVTLRTPKRGEKLALVETANLNAKEEADRADSREEKTARTLQWLQNALGLERPPGRIEAFDVSNLGASDMVASMTVFVRGKPLKKDYRKFKIKYRTGQSDYHSMREVLTRRFKRYLAGDEKFARLPDLLLIDGGSTHAGAALGVLKELGLTVPVYGMVKDSRHRTRALISPGGEEIGMGAVPAVFALIGNIQEETHRFAIEYHRSLRSKNSYGSTLDKIEGVGEKRRNDLLRHFKSIKNIREATLEQLAEIVPKSTAEAVFSYFSNGDDKQ